MFAKLFDFFAKWFDAIVKFHQSAFSTMVYLLGAGFGAILGFLIFIKESLQTINQFCFYLASKIDQIGVPVGLTDGLSTSISAGGITSALLIMNTFFPLTEMFVCILLLLNLALCLTIYGLVKSWIPTVSG